MQRTLEELLTDVRAVVEDDTTDEVLALLENITDTMNAASTEAIVDLQNRLTDLDNAWRKKFRDRFFNTAAADPGPDPVGEEEETKEKITRYEQLFS